jgi:hypothetical protein
MPFFCLFLQVVFEFLKDLQLLQFLVLCTFLHADNLSKTGRHQQPSKL